MLKPRFMSRPEGDIWQSSTPPASATNRVRISLAIQHTLLGFFFSRRRRHTRFKCEWSSDVCSSDLNPATFFACSRREFTMKHDISRRQFTKLAIGAAIVGFNPDERSWVTQSSNTARPFDRVPKLDGALLLDEESRRAIAIDQGNMFHRVPAAVLRPGSVDDIVAMVRSANQHKLKVAIRGNGHSRYGQTQAEAGVVIDSRSLNAVRVRTPQSADAQPGALWSAVADTTLPKVLTPRLFPGTCLDLITVGGMLNAGGIGNMSPRYGALVDNVTNLDVVTGDGHLVTCSHEHESELFDMVLAGQGQCGVIVRAGLPLIPAPTHVLYHELTYTDLDAYLSHPLRLARDRRFNGQPATMLRDPSGTWSFRIEIGKFFTPPNEPNMRALEG